MESEFGVRLKQLRCDNNMKIQEFVDLYNVKFKENKLSKSIVSRYENGVHLPKRFQIVSNIAQFFNVDTDYLMGRLKEKKRDSNFISHSEATCFKIPVLLSIDTSGPVYSDKPIIESDCYTHSIQNKLFYFQAKDNSMMNSGIVKNAHVQFTNDFIPKNGDIVAVYEKDCPIQIRKYLNQGSIIALSSDCNEIDPILIQKDNIDQDKIRIFGKALKIITFL
jgi:SOS-response transcriptional repressor LexA